MAARVITALAAKGDQRLAVELDGKPWIVLDVLTVRELGFDRGLVLSAAEKTNAEAKAREQRALARAASMVGRRSHAKAELERRLTQRDGADAARSATERLAELGAVDDGRHAREVAQHRLRAGWGPARIAHDLATAGVAEAEIAEALASITSDDVEAAARTAIGTRTGAEAWQRLSARGFDEETAEHIAGVPFDD